MSSYYDNTSLDIAINVFYKVEAIYKESVAQEKFLKEILSVLLSDYKKVNKYHNEIDQIEMMRAGLLKEDAILIDSLVKNEKYINFKEKKVISPEKFEKLSVKLNKINDSMIDLYYL